MLNQMAEMTFAIGGLLVALLLALRGRSLSPKERISASTAAFGLFLCARYAAIARDIPDALFVTPIAFMMFLLAYNSLGFRTSRR